MKILRRSPKAQEKKSEEDEMGRKWKIDRELKIGFVKKRKIAILLKNSPSL